MRFALMDNWDFFLIFSHRILSFLSLRLITQMTYTEKKQQQTQKMQAREENIVLFDTRQHTWA